MTNNTNPDHKLLRRVNHIQPHKVVPSKTLMRSVVSPPQPSLKRQLKGHAVSYHKPVSLEPKPRQHINEARLSRAEKATKSQFVSHFAKPDARSFMPSPQPIMSVLSKPDAPEHVSIDELLHKAMDRIDDEVQNLEQQPIRRFNRFTRSLVANRFNGIALD